MKHIVVKLLALIALACSLATTARAESFAKRVDIRGGRMMYIECHGSGSPTVLLISGTDTASDLWHAADQKGPTVYDDIQKTTRVCAYDRPGAPHLDQTFSRSDPVPQPTSPQNGVDDLLALLKAADVPGPYILVAHSFSGTIARVFAGQHPDEVKGIVFVDVLTPESSLPARLTAQLLEPIGCAQASTGEYVILDRRARPVGEPKNEIRFTCPRPRPAHTFLFDGIVGLAKSCGVDDRHRIAIEIELNLDDVARRAGMR